MSRRGTLRTVVLPVAQATAFLVVLLYCASRAVVASGFGDHLPGGYAALGPAVAGVALVTVVERRRNRDRARDLPASLTAAQRDEVVTAARSGPVPQDPLVRAEARRQAEQRSDTVGPGLRRNAAVLAGLALLGAAAGAVWSAWWWGDAALLAAVAGLQLHRHRQRLRHLHLLRRSAELPPPPPDGVHRLVDAEAPDLTGSGRGVLELRVRLPWGGAGSGTPRVRLNGGLVAAEWGRNRYLVPAGTLTVNVWVDYLGSYGRATTTTVVPSAGTAVLHDAQPALTLLDGAIGPEPQRSRGARVLAGVGLAVLALLVALIVLDP